MNYEDLVLRGFEQDVLDFTAAAEKACLLALPRLVGVYAVVIPHPQPCRLGESDIVYVGKGTNANGLRGRIRQYFHPGPTQSTCIPMNARLRDETHRLRLGYITTAKKALAQRLESDVLLEFESQHGQRPRFNRQRALDLLSRLAEKRAD